MNRLLLFDLQRLLVVGGDVDVEFETRVVNVDWFDVFAFEEIAEAFGFRVG